MYFGVTIQPTALAPVDSLFPMPCSALLLHPQEGSMTAWVSSVRMLGWQAWPKPDSTALQALCLPLQGPDPPWLEARAAVSAAPVTVTLTENHTRHMAESPRGCPVPCSLFAYDVSTLIRTV